MRITLLFLVSSLVWAQKPLPRPAPSPAAVPPMVQNHASGLGASVAGLPLHLGAPGRRPFVPIVGSFWGNGWNQPQMMPYYVQQAPPVFVQQQVPIVSVNPTYTPEVIRPSMREYFAESKPYEAVEPKKATSSVTLIAFKDGTLVQAVAYWYEGETMHYVKPDHKVEKTTLALVDKESSLRFNQERGLTFRMP